jgi:flagellar basal-body rod protein FlgB
MFEPTKLLTLMANKLEWHKEMTHRIGHNIANSETPGFKRVDLKSFNDILKSNASLFKKNQSSLTPIMPINNRHQIQTRDEVKRDVESMIMAENSVNHQANLQLYKKYLGLMKTVVAKT